MPVDLLGSPPQMLDGGLPCDNRNFADLLHIDCRWDFQAMYRLRDELTERYGLRMLVHASDAANDPAVNRSTCRATSSPG